MEKIYFASDNYSGICPEAIEGFTAANIGSARAYGDDEFTREAVEKICRIFKKKCHVFFVFNGTAANSLALSSLCKSYHSIICHEHAHIETDECGGPEFFSNGTKLLTVGGASGKIDLAAVERVITRRSDVHYPRPRVLSITQPTEMGTLYSPAELKKINAMKKKYGLRLHMDGARFANAVASTGLHPSELSWKAGVDVLCLGGAKNGMGLGEAILFFDSALADEFNCRCKQSGQLASKQRFISSPWIRMMEDGAWIKHADHANRMAGLLEKKLKTLKGIDIAYPCQVNSVFVKMNERISRGLRNMGWHFYNFIGTDCCRFMCSWNTTEEQVDALYHDMKFAAEHGG